MRKYILSVAAAVSLGAATPAMAYDSGSLLASRLKSVLPLSLTRSSPVMNGRSKAATQPASIWKSTSMPRRARCSTSTDKRD
jgi:hypothetical protein